MICCNDNMTKLSRRQEARRLRQSLQGMHARTRAHKPARTHACTHACMHARLLARTHARSHARALVYTCMHGGMHGCMHTGTRRRLEDRGCRLRCDGPTDPSSRRRKLRRAGMRCIVHYNAIYTMLRAIPLCTMPHA